MAQTGSARASGFDVILGNPPWDHVELKEAEFFAQRDPSIAGALNAAARKKAIAALEDTNPGLLAEFEEATRRAEGERHLLASTGRFPLCGRGRINTYAVFAESMRDALGCKGQMGVIVPTGIATDDTTKYFFGDLIQTRTLRALYDFENQGMFEDVHSSYKFCVLVVAGSTVTAAEARIDFSFFAHSVTEAMAPDHRFSMSPEDIMLLNPNTRTCPVFRSERDAEITKAIYRRVPVLARDARGGQAEVNEWGLRFSQGLFNMASDSGRFRTRDVLEADGWELSGNRFRRDGDTYLPLYEAKMTSLYDHRHGNVVGSDDLAALSGIPAVATTDEQHRDPAFCAMPRYWVSEGEVRAAVEGNEWPNRYFIVFRDLARSTDARTAIHSVIPWAAVNHKTPILLPLGVETRQHAALIANLNSFVYDYTLRQKIGGASVSFFIVKQTPALPPEAYDQPCPWGGVASAAQTLLDWIVPRVLELVYTSHDLAPFAEAMSWSGPPFVWDADRRFQIRCELDAAMFHAYGVDRSSVEHILDSFPVCRRYDTERFSGEYRTKTAILSIYDGMTEAKAAGTAWQSTLSPLPGDRLAAHTPGTLAAGADPATKTSPIRPAAVRRSEAIDQHAAVIAAFLDVRQGRSPDYVVCEPGLNAAFVAAARDRGAVADAAALNRMLLGARKTGVLSDHPTTAEYRMPKALTPYAFVAEWAARHLQRQELLRHDEPPSLDDILCDPNLAAQFDELASRIKPGIKPLDIRWAALGFRKTARKAAAPGSVAVEPTDRVDAGSGIKQLPEKPGLYLIVAGQQVLYANYTRDLRDQLTRHAEVAKGALAPEWLLPKQSRPDTVRWAWFQSLTPDAVAEARIHLVTEYRPWLNLLETGAA